MVTTIQSNPRRFGNLVLAVGDWSLYNFGVNVSKSEIAVGSLHDFLEGAAERQLRSPLILNSVASFLGMIEEFGELAEAVVNDDLGLTKDAVADIMIYLTDFYARSQTPVNLRWEEIDVKLDVECPVCNIGGSSTFAIRTVGLLSHAVLKHHQGIRGYDKPEVYVPEVNAAIENLIVCVGRFLSLAKQNRARQEGMQDVLTYAAVDGAEILTLTEHEWARVSKRDWKKNPATGV